MHRKLAELLKTRKGKYILFLGAGASLTSGGKTAKELVEDVVERFTLDSHTPWDSFCNFLREINEKEKFDIFSKYFEDMKPSPGYETLANLIKEGYFRLILTTNFDFMLEEALTRTGLVPNKDYFVCVVGAEKEDILIKKVEDNSMIRIVKLHGDYKTGILPFTEEETFTFEDNMKSCLNKLTREGIVFVGYSAMDRDIVTCLPYEGGSVWWVNPKKVTADTTIAQRNPDEYELNERFYQFLMNRKSHRNFIWGNYGKSDTFFKNIAKEIFERDINGFCDQFKFGATRYRKMKDLFEPPYQYDEMKQKLEKYRILLILGEPHLGKTYTALNLLYDYYVEGFQVMYRSELELKDVHHEILYEWEKLLTPETVIYFEDPFGKTEPENVQVFREELESIIQRIQNSKSMVIMTSRLNVFKEVGNPDDFPMIVELMKKDKSYDMGKRMKIIDNYAAVYKPAWRKLLNESMNGEILREYIARELTEPHNIDMLFEKSLEMGSVDILLEKVEESKEILKAFRKEIERSSTGEKIFFYSCYIFERKWKGFIHVKRLYPVILRDFGFDPFENSFENLLRKYDFRVETYEGFFGSEIKFSHPEFSNAVEESFNRNSSIIGRILFDLAKDEDVRGAIAETVRDNFEKLTEEYRRILFDLVKDKNGDVRRTVAETVRDNFEKLTEEYRRILFNLAKDEDGFVRGTVARTVGDNFEKLTEEYRRILFDLAKDENGFVRGSVAGTVGDNFEKLTEEYRRILFDLAKDEYRYFRWDLVKDENEYVRRTVAGTVGDNFEKLTEEYRRILFDLAKDEYRDVRGTVARTVGDNFEKLTEEYRRILFDLAKDEDRDVRGSVAGTVRDNFEILTEEYRRILFNLAKDKNGFVRKTVARTVWDNFEKLTEEYRRILFDLAKDEYIDIRWTVAGTVGHKFEILTEEYRRILFNLAKDKNGDVRRTVARTVGYNFEILTEEYRRILFDLAKDEDEYVRGTLARTVGDNFEILTEEYRRLLLALSDDMAVSVKKTVALTISTYFEKLPEDYQKALKKFETDIPVINSLNVWIKESEKYEWRRETIETLKRELISQNSRNKEMGKR